MITGGNSQTNRVFLHRGIGTFTQVEDLSSSSASSCLSVTSRFMKQNESVKCGWASLKRHVHFLSLCVSHSVTFRTKQRQSGVTAAWVQPGADFTQQAALWVYKAHLNAASDPLVSAWDCIYLTVFESRLLAALCFDWTSHKQSHTICSSCFLKHTSSSCYVTNERSEKLSEAASLSPGCVPAELQESCRQAWGLHTVIIHSSDKNLCHSSVDCWVYEVSKNCERNGRHSFQGADGDAFKCRPTLPNPKIFSLVSFMTKKSSKLSHLRSWNQRTLGISHCFFLEKLLKTLIIKVVPNCFFKPIKPIDRLDCWWTQTEHRQHKASKYPNHFLI